MPGGECVHATTHTFGLYKIVLDRLVDNNNRLVVLIQFEFEHHIDF